jgi:1-aminocyclopropane-1-carboxylate deaminase
MLPVHTENIFTQSILLPLGDPHKLKMDVLRLDEMHEYISGNKWFKLRYHLDTVKKQNKTLVTFGGPWSNHLLASAAACKLEQIPVIGIIRGEKPRTLSFVLEKCEEFGMELQFISREDYRNKKLPASYASDQYYLVPEGGYSIKGMEGVSSTRDFFKQDHYDYICLAAGTGTTAAGLLMKGTEKIIAVSVLKNNYALSSAIEQLTGKENERLAVLHDYSFGGYADHTPELFQFMNDLYLETQIPTDFVYTGKLLYGINDLAGKNYFSPGNKILIIHSGGLKGNSSLGKGTLIF